MTTKFAKPAMECLFGGVVIVRLDGAENFRLFWEHHARDTRLWINALSDLAKLTNANHVDVSGQTLRYWILPALNAQLPRLKAECFSDALYGVERGRCIGIALKEVANGALADASSLAEFVLGIEGVR